MYFMDTYDRYQGALIIWFWVRSTIGIYRKTFVGIGQPLNDLSYFEEINFCCADYTFSLPKQNSKIVSQFASCQLNESVRQIQPLDIPTCDIKY
jgi:hypothetical protein